MGFFRILLVKFQRLFVDFIALIEESLLEWVPHRPNVFNHLLPFEIEEIVYKIDGPFGRFPAVYRGIEILVAVSNSFRSGVNRNVGTGISVIKEHPVYSADRIRVPAAQLRDHPVIALRTGHVPAVVDIEKFPHILGGEGCCQRTFLYPTLAIGHVPVVILCQVIDCSLES